MQHFPVAAKHAHFFKQFIKSWRDFYSKEKFKFSVAYILLLTTDKLFRL